MVAIVVGALLILLGLVAFLIAALVVIAMLDGGKGLFAKSAHDARGPMMACGCVRCAQERNRRVVAAAQNGGEDCQRSDPTINQGAP